MSLGVYVGPRDVQGVRNFETLVGRPVNHVVDFTDGRDWNTLEDPGWFVRGWAATGYTVEFSVPMMPPGYSLQDGASGVFNDHWRRMALNFITNGYANAVLRIGWEMNGHWFPWYAENDPQAFREYWRQIVRTMRDVPGAKFRYDWCPTLGHADMANPEDAWPGSRYVHRIGVDVYDNYYGGGRMPSAAERWNTILMQPYGLQWHADFAAAHGKTLTFPEWGLTHVDDNGGGDNPLFIEQMYAWTKDHRVTAYYFQNDDGGNQRHRLELFPNALARVRTLWAPR